MRYYFAGTETRAYAELLKSMGVVNTLQSYYHLGFKRPPNEFGFPNFLLDSGGFTIRKTGCTDVDVRSYADFINAHRDGVRLAFNLDTADMAESIDNQLYLEASCAAIIIPIYHYSDWIDPKWRDVLRRWVHDQGYGYVAIAGVAAPNKNARARFYAYCFDVVRDRARIHGLAATGIDDMLRFPFYSVDSTTWLNAEKFGEWHRFRDGRIVKQKSLRVEAKAQNPRVRDVNLLINDKQHFMRASIQAFLDFERYVTSLWEQRGVRWDGN